MPQVQKVDILEAYRLRTVAKLTYEQIGELQGVSKQAISSALYRFADSLPTLTELTAYDAAKTALLSVAEERLIASIADPTAIEKASLLDRGRTFKAVHTALRLEKEQSTANVHTKMALLIKQADDTLFTQAPDPSTPPSSELAE